MIEGNTFIKHDADKLLMHLVEPNFIEGIAKVLTHGARKYAPDNWRRCDQPFERYYSALQRHLIAYAQGRDIDPESGLPHLYHAACCLMFLAWFDEQPVDVVEEQGGYKPHMPFTGLRDPSHP